MNLGEDRAIFEFPWLQTFSLDIDWRQAKIKGKTTTRTMTEQPLYWAQISRIAFIARCIAKKQKLEKGEKVHMRINKTNVAQQWAEKLLKEKKNELTTEATIPAQYAEYSDVFLESAARQFPPHREDDHAINFKPGTPDMFSCKIYPISLKETAYLREWVSENFDKQFIRESKSPFASPTLLIKKKNSDYQVIQDYCTLNEHTIPDVSPLLLIGEIISKLHGWTLFTKFNIRSGYHNIRIHNRDQQKAVFKTNVRHYEPMVMNFSLRNTPATFQRLMNQVMRPVKAKFREDLQTYMDNIIIATKDNLPYHHEVVHAVLLAMRNASLFLKPEKCKFEKRKVEYLGLLLDGDTIRPDPSKVEGLWSWPMTLKTVKDVHSTLGILNYNCAFIPGFAQVAKPLTKLLKKDAPFVWTDKCTNTIQGLIDKVTNEPILVHPDPQKDFELEVDASNYATGAILFQQDKRGKPRPIGYHSKTFSNAERNYNIYDKELTAIDRGLANWRHLLLGNKVIIHTDHANLTYYQHPHKLSDRARRAIARLMQYNVVINHKPGIHIHAHTLSR